MRGLFYITKYTICPRLARWIDHLAVFKLLIKTPRALEAQENLVKLENFASLFLGLGALGPFWVKRI